MTIPHPHVYIILLVEAAVEERKAVEAYKLYRIGPVLAPGAFWD
jgi:hypothetical protein